MLHDDDTPMAGTATASPAELLHRNNLHAKKSWGQCFLGDVHTLQRIAESCSLSKGETVVELGAGLGHLTRALAATGANVVAVERDRDMIAILEKTLVLPNVRLVAGNAARVNLAEISGVPRPVVAGNLPYQLTSPILFELLAQCGLCGQCIKNSPEEVGISRAVFLLQKEVVERLASPPGTRNCGVLSVLLAACADVSNLFDVPRTLFTPSPRVDSAVIRIDFHTSLKVELTSWAGFEKLVKAAFSLRRKMLRSALKPFAAELSTIPLDEAFRLSGVDRTSRAENLSLEEFAALSNALAAAEKPLFPSSSTH